jgi:hypothetical protein
MTWEFTCFPEHLARLSVSTATQLSQAVKPILLLPERDVEHVSQQQGDSEDFATQFSP